MKLKTIVLIYVLGCYLTTTATGQKSLDDLIDTEIPSLVDTYKMLHASPELSTKEEKTSAFLAKELKSLGYNVTDHIGKYSKPDLKTLACLDLMDTRFQPVCFSWEQLILLK